jgi:hypothetical protein
VDISFFAPGATAVIADYPGAPKPLGVIPVAARKKIESPGTPWYKNLLMFPDNKAHFREQRQKPAAIEALSWASGR